MQILADKKLHCNIYLSESQELNVKCLKNKYAIAKS